MSVPVSAPLSFLPHAVRGVLSMLFLVLNTLVCASVLLPLSLLKLIVPLPAMRRAVDPALHGIVDFWSRMNAAWMTLVSPTEWRVKVEADLRRDRWYFVIANHQSWADIFVMHKVLVGRMPMLKFVLKQQLLYIPVIGLAWWALDFPFMKRHSAEFLKKHPERKGDDLRAIRKACERFALVPSSMMNYLEGTRFTTEKHRSTGSPYRHLLKPKIGGFALTLQAMGEKFHSLIDVTIFYPGGAPTFFEFISGRTRAVDILVMERPIPQELRREVAANDPEWRARVAEWVESLWREKDERMAALSAEC